MLRQLVTRTGGKVLLAGRTEVGVMSRLRLRGVAVVQHERIPVRILEERHVTDAASVE